MIWSLLSTVLGGILLLSGVPKLRESAAMLTVVRGYRLLPAALERLVARVLPTAQVILGAALVVGIPLRAVPLAATGLFLVFFAALAINLLRGRRDLDCGCFGFAGSEETPRIGWFHAVRALLLAFAAGVLAIAPDRIGLGFTPPAEQLIGTAIAAVLFAGALAALSLRRVIHPGRRTVDSHLAAARTELRAATLSRS